MKITLECEEKKVRRKRATGKRQLGEREKTSRTLCDFTFNTVIEILQYYDIKEKLLILTCMLVT